MSILNAIKEDARYVFENADFVELDLDQIDYLVANILTDDELKKWITHGDETEAVFGKSRSIDSTINYEYSVPIEIRDRINLLSVLDLINFASGFRHVLANNYAKGAFLTIKAGVLKLYETDPNFITAKGMAELTENQVANEFGLQWELLEEAKGRNEIHDLVKKIHHVLTSTGSILLYQNLIDFTDFLFYHTDKDENLASNLVSVLVDTFPAFSDVANFKGKTVHIVKKAQLLTADLYRQVRHHFPERFNFKDISELTIMSDNVIPAVLRKFGILKVKSEELRNILNSSEILPSGQMEVELRVVAIHACELIIKKYNDAHPDKKLPTMDLDFYLWAKGKDTGFRTFPRHYTQDTIYY